MTLRHARIAAVTALLLTPVILFATVNLRWHRPPTFDASLVPFLVLAGLLTLTRNPHRTTAACLAYLPVGYLFMTEPFTQPRSQGSGGLIYVLWPLFIAFLLVATFLGGALLRLVFGPSSDRLKGNRAGSP